MPVYATDILHVGAVGLRHPLRLTQGRCAADVWQDDHVAARESAGRFLLGSVASFGLARSFPDAVVAYAPVVAAMTAGIPSLRRHRTDDAARNEDTEMAAG